MTYEEAITLYDAAESYEKMLLNGMMELWKREGSNFQDLLSEIMDKEPEIPGRIFPNSSLFYLNLKEDFFEHKESDDSSFSVSSCSLDIDCQLGLTEAVSFVTILKVLYSVEEFSSDFLSRRIDLYQGRLLLNFANRIKGNQQLNDMTGGFSLPCRANKIKDPKIRLVLGMLVSYFMGETPFFLSSEDIDCINSTKKLLTNFYETFIEVTKHSVFKNSLSGIEEKQNFKKKYEEILIVTLDLKPNLTHVPTYVSDQVEQVGFCIKSADIQEQFNKTNISTTTCEFFDPILTPKGPCFAFNSISMKNLYKETDQIKSWNQAFGHDTPSIWKADGYGPKKGFTFLVNSFDKYLENLKSENFLLSISNAYAPHYIIFNNYIIEPGHIYTFRVLAQQIASSKALKNMRQEDRNCLLVHENGKLNFSNFYTKSTCLYECLVLQAAQECGCVPWYLPYFEDKQYCDIREPCFVDFSSNDNKKCGQEYDFDVTNCFQNNINNAEAIQCDCPTECEETHYNTVAANQLFHLPSNFCTNEILNIEYPYNVYCGICQKIITNHKIRLIYDYYVNKGPNPNDIDDFCQHFITKHVALVKIEMVSNSVVRSIRDKRFSFISQVSALGK
jgi:hypothetical protein